MNEEYINQAMNLIFIAGNAKSLALESLSYFEKKENQIALEKLKQSKQELHKAHQIQTKLMQEEMNGKVIEKSLLMIHAQDHFMASETVIELIERLTFLLKG